MWKEMVYFLSGNLQLANAHSPGEGLVANPTAFLPLIAFSLSCFLVWVLILESPSVKTTNKNKTFRTFPLPFALGNTDGENRCQESERLFKVYGLQQGGGWLSPHLCWVSIISEALKLSCLCLLVNSIFSNMLMKFISWFFKLIF